MSTVDMFDELVSLLTDSGVQEVIQGLPDTMETETVAYVIMGPRSLEDVRAGLLYRTVTFYVYLGYRVDGREDDAERGLMDLMDAIEMGYLEARKTGPFRNSSLSMTMASGPDYRDFTSQEYRFWPFSIDMIEQFNRP